MKKVFIILFILWPAAYLTSQTPGKFSFQSVLRDMNGNVLAGNQTGVLIELFAGDDAGHLIYSEKHTVTTNAEGLLTLIIGTGSDATGEISGLKWHQSPVFIRASLDPSGGTSWTMSDTLMLTSTPLALYAKSAGKVLIPLNETQGLSDVITLGDSAGSRLINVTDPVESKDALTLNYLYGLLSNYLKFYGIGPRFVQDYEGNVYNTIRIGNAIWMTENLRSTKTSLGEDIPLVTNAVEWSGTTEGAYCWYNNEPPNSYLSKTCGAYYNWYTVNTLDICPEGYHIPDNNDWTELIDALGGESTAGGKLKASGTKFWNIPNVLGTNQSGFTGLPSGFRAGVFEGIGSTALWWSSNESSVENGNAIGLTNISSVVSWLPISKKCGLSVRCINSMMIIDP